MATAAPYTKPHLSLGKQVSLLQSRGVQIPDVADAERVLRAIGYYRLSGYWYPFRALSPDGHRRLDQFAPGTTFLQIVALYDFDRRLKLHLLDALERIEIAARLQVGYVLGRRGAYAHLDPTNLDAHFDRPKANGGPSKYQTLLGRIKDQQDRSRDDFVEHFRTKYDGRLPTWVVTEVLDFGAVSMLYSGLLRSDRDEIAAEFGAFDAGGGGNGRTLGNWLWVLSYLRNISAHHSRLWNRNMDNQLAPSLLAAIPHLAHLRTPPPAQVTRVFGSLCLVLFLLNEAADDAASTRWRHDLVDLLIHELPPTGRTLNEMGFPAQWQAIPLWR